LPERLVDAMREFTGTLLSPYDLDAVLDRLLRQTMVALNAAGAGIMLADESGELGFAAASDQRVEPVELAQGQTDSGACYEAYHCNQVVAVADLRSEDRWPYYTVQALEQGFQAVVGVPLTAWGQTIGVLNVYRDTPTLWTDADVDACQIVAGMGAAYILGAKQVQAQHELACHLDAALQSRGAIERAKGMIMAKAHVDADTAFERLRQRSMHRNQKLRDVAADIVQSGWIDPHLITSANSRGRPS
jgi:signal transduction protein with GAF and PtsI domain